MGRLSTHVLDTAQGRPAAGMKIELYACAGAERRLLKTARTNSDGRTSDPFLEAGSLAAGIYEFVFHAGDYFGSADPKFLDQIVVRFTISDASANYHVPLLVTPHGYTTYRGS